MHVRKKLYWREKGFPKFKKQQWQRKKRYRVSENDDYHA